MLIEQFPDLYCRITVGLSGEGSECFGFDDEISRDHDFEAGFCIWIRKEDSEKYGFKLERAYASLPKEFMGLKKSLISPVGGNRHGVMTADDFYGKFLIDSKAPSNWEAWLNTPPSSLAAASNGEIFHSGNAQFDEIRFILKKGYPEDIRKKKLSAHAAFMAQSGQYNYGRLIRRNETGAAQLAVFEFVKHAISSVFLLNNSYEPFYKWSYRAMRELPLLSELETPLSELTQLDNGKRTAETKAEIIEDIAGIFINEYKNQSLTKAKTNSLVRHAYSIAEGIENSALRNMHIMNGA